MRAFVRFLLAAVCLVASFALGVRRARAYETGIALGGGSCMGCHVNGIGATTPTFSFSKVSGTGSVSGTTVTMDASSSITFRVTISASNSHAGIDLTPTDTALITLSPGEAANEQNSGTEVIHKLNPSGCYTAGSSPPGTCTSPKSNASPATYDVVISSGTTTGSTTITIWANAVNWNGADTGDQAGSTTVTVNVLKANGASCGGGGECFSGNCADGFCCNTSSCTGPCQACNATGTCQNTVTPVHAGCGSGACAGSCSGSSSSCTYGTGLCAAASCSNASDSEQAASFCSSGTCVPGATTSCGLYACSGAICGTTCSTDTDCNLSALCDTTVTPHTCVSSFGIGHTCASDAQCTSGHCADGYCCDAACGGQCQACDISSGTGLGHCQTVTSGQPHGTRTACTGGGAAPCGGTCDGSSATACAYPPASTSCRLASCSDATDSETFAASCDGAGSCPTAVLTSCGPYKCAGTICGTTCTFDTDCRTGAICDTTVTPHVCTGLFSNGHACTYGGQCTSGNCIDGVCCDTTCGASCDACDVGGSVGTCTRLTSGQPHGTRGACTGAGTAPCGGSCDGTSDGCTFPSTSTSCRTASCSNTTHLETASATCNGAGTCPAAVTTSCGLYECSGTVCGTTCASDTDCVSPALCDTAATPHVCVSSFSIGHACTSATQCGSGFCVDGVCCNAACGAQCQACDVSGSVGACTNVPSGQPHGSRGACTGAGTAPCGGSCDGTSSVCSYPPTSTNCRTASCTGGTATAGANCDGAGNCPSPATSTCAPYTCGSTSCKTSCTVDTDCVAGDTCIGGTCGGKLSNGSACTSGTQCTSSFCVDGVCCNSACTGQCQACDAPVAGTCSFVSGSPHGSRPACAGGGTTCGGTCGGTSATCTYPTSACRAATCTSGIATASANCDGAGACPTASTTLCAPYVCTATSCKTTCGSDADCIPGDFCKAGVCSGKKANGTACAAASECNSGLCVDGVCCDKACTGQCEACNVSGSLGTCSPATGAPVGSRTACASDGSLCGGKCDGALRTACTYPPSTTSCRAASCTSGVATLSATCTGSGTCPSLMTVDCAPLTCNVAGTACAGGCTVDTDCTAGHFCGGGVCQPKLGLGATCGAANQCTSGFCVDGVCCNSACTGQCGACNVPAKGGTCSPVTGAPTGGRAACATDGTMCGGTCDGTTTTACHYPDATTSCRTASCTGGVATVGAGCDGTGQCPPLSTKVCAPYACSGTSCGGGCTLDSDCASGDYCNAGSCVPKITVGAPCSSSASCTSGFCVDHVCCESLCDRQCEACDISGAVGVCAPVRSGAPHPPRPACAPIGGCPASCNGDPTTCSPSADCEAADAGDTGTTSDATTGDTSTSSDSSAGDAGGDGSSDGPPVKPDATPSGDGSVGPGGDASFDGQPNENGDCACRTAGGAGGDARFVLVGLGAAIAVVLARRRRRR